MKAAQYSKYGSWKEVKVNEVDTPILEEDQVLVKVFAASINPFDFKVRSGSLRKVMPLKFPVTIGGDFAGVVEQVGSSAKKYKRGDKVFGQAGFYSKGSGSMAEMAAADTGKINFMPKNINFVEAASLPLAGQSAVQALTLHIKLRKNQKILIHGGAGGIGSIALQIVKAIGAYVVTTVSGQDMDFVRELGADKILNYKKDDFTKGITDFNAVFDTVGGEVANESFQVLKSGGKLVTMTASFDKDLANKYKVEAIKQNTSGSSELLNTVRKYIEEGKVKPEVDKVFSLSDVAKAFEYQETSHPRGKVVVKIS